ncbi:MAG: cyclic nucleotide-gated ion channel [Pseudomonadota bacterium]|nr:cyclic nucleotide-gated ion channel [Pseudomonadota bacterium]
MDQAAGGGGAAFRRLMHNALADEGHGPSHLLAMVLVIAAVLAATTATLVESMPDHALWADLMLELFRAYAALVFSVEMAGRLWLARDLGQAPAGRSVWRSRRDYLVSFQGIIDIVAVLPAWISVLYPVDDGVFQLVGALVLLKLARYVQGLALVGAVIRHQVRSLVAAVIAMGVLLVIGSTAMYLLEHPAQPELFASIPHTLWWGIATMATVGYGDMVPVTAAGRLFGGFIMLLGIAMFAVPAGILATGFAEELKKREFMVTWRMVARVPLFQHMDAASIATIAGLLRTRIVPAHAAIVRRDAQADAMYFILDGAVEVEIRPAPVRLGPGDWFGELALLGDLRRTATVTAITQCRLMALDIADFRHLMESYPAIRQEIEQVAAKRRGAGPD